MMLEKSKRRAEGIEASFDGRRLAGAATKHSRYGVAASSSWLQHAQSHHEETQRYARRQAEAAQKPSNFPEAAHIIRIKEMSFILTPHRNRHSLCREALALPILLFHCLLESYRPFRSPLCIASIVAIWLEGPNPFVLAALSIFRNRGERMALFRELFAH